MLSIALQANESLIESPTLTLKPTGVASPIVVPLTVDPMNPTRYTGQYDVTQFAPTGPVAVSVSGKDLVGNTFSGAPTGPALTFDTDGPVGTLSTSQPPPVQVLNTVNLTVFLTLSEAAKVGSVPTVQFIPPTGSPIGVSMIGSGQNWQGSLALEPAMGQGIGSFTLSALDALNNTGTSIANGGQLEIYNSGSPDPATAPNTLTATAKPAGEIQLQWNAVSKATGYALYRRAGDCTTDPDVLVADGLNVTSLTDLPPSDGAYCYGVKSERLGATSDFSPFATAVSDRVAPPVPENVAVVAGIAGILVSWDAPTSDEVPTSYRVLRDGNLIRTVNGGSPGFSISDHPPVGGSFSYVVVSRDAVGNETAAAPVPFDLLVGAVSNLVADVPAGQPPVLTWENTDPNTVGYNVYKGGVKQNTTPLTVTTFTDAFFAGAARADYAVTAVDNDGDESPNRVVTVFPVEIGIVPNPAADGTAQPLLTNNFSTLRATLMNRDATAPFPLDEVGLTLTVGGSQTFSNTKMPDVEVLPQETNTTDFIVPIGGMLDDHIFQVTYRHVSEGGAMSVYRRSVVVDGDTQVSLSLNQITLALDDVPLAGGITSVQLCMQNGGYIPIDVVTARSSGQDPGDISVSILNASGLTISSTAFKGVPSGSITFQGTTFLRIQPGQQSCVMADILVPVNLQPGDQITFVGSVADFNSNLLASGVGSAGGLSGTVKTGITFSPYYATAQADKDAYSNDETVMITGQAIERATGNPVPNAPIKVGLFVRGFKWFIDATTDGAGNYAYQYDPTPGLAGEFIAWGAHPDVFDVIDQDRFTVARLYAQPAQGLVRSSKGDTFAFKIKVLNPDGGPTLDNFTLDFRAFTVDGGGMEVPEPTLHGGATFPSGFSIGPGATKEVELSITADLGAPDSAMIEYRLVSAQGAVAVFTGNLELAPAVPTIVVTNPSRGFVDVSVNRGSVLTVPVTVKNTGLRPLENAELIPPASVTWLATNQPLAANGRLPLGTIAVGEERTFDVVLSPPSTEPFGSQLDEFEIVGTNSPQQFPVQVLALVTSNLKGSVQFQVGANTGQPVLDATIRMKKPEIFEEITPVKTDFNGEATVTGLQEGIWSYQVVAAGHTTAAGTVVVQADQTTLQEVELNRSLVSIEFRVEPVPFTDRYTIKIEQTFVTNVPVPVLVVDPPYVQFNDVTPGFQTTVVANVRNEGLIDIREVTIKGQQTAVARSQPLITYLPRLKAQQSVQVPFVVTYYGQGNAPAFAPGCADNNPISSMGDFFAGLNNIILGSAPSQLSGVDHAIAGGIAMGLAAAAFVSLEGTLGSIVGWIGYCLFGGFFGDGGGGGPGASSPSVSSGYGPGGVGCFTSGTPIRMADGSQKPIELVRKGDEVLTVAGTAARVTETYKRSSDHIRELRYRMLPVRTNPRLSVGLKDDGRLRRLQTTDEHHFWVLDKETWVTAGALKVGDRFAMSDGTVAELYETNRFEGETVVYNFDVEGYHSYFANDVLVRQQCGGKPEVGVEALIRRLLNGETVPEFELPQRVDMTQAPGGTIALPPELRHEASAARRVGPPGATRPAAAE